MAPGQDIKKIAMIGCGSMGGGMALLFAEHGVHVSLQDPSSDAMDKVLSDGHAAGVQSQLSKHTDYADLCTSLDSPKVIVFSLPHGDVGDAVLADLSKHLEPGDIIIDASNENWQNTQRRQGKLIAQGGYYVGMGVSGGYQAARRGPSMCPGGDARALDLVLPLLEKVCARGPKQELCVGKVGQGGSGHYVKMVHNGIEQGMMCAISEAYQLMQRGLGMSLQEIGDEFARWNAEGELHNTFLVGISADICRTKDATGNYVLASVKDKVVQDADETEGTGIWTLIEATRLHTVAPSIATAHFLRLASADRKHRLRQGHTTFNVPHVKHIEGDRAAICEDLRLAVWGSILTNFSQGLVLIDRADKENRWGIDFNVVTRIWRGGCIIRCDYFTDLMAVVYASSTKKQDRNPMLGESFADEINKAYPPLKRLVLKGVESDCVLPCLTASLEYLKYSANTELPTDFYEAQLDYFGKHMFDLKSEPPGEPVTGKHHYEWKPA